MSFHKIAPIGKNRKAAPAPKPAAKVVAKPSARKPAAAKPRPVNGHGR
jgi:hypothetical protein